MAATTDKDELDKASIEDANTNIENLKWYRKYIIELNCNSHEFILNLETTPSDINIQNLLPNIRDYFYSGNIKETIKETDSSIKYYTEVISNIEKKYEKEN